MGRNWKAGLDLMPLDVEIAGSDTLFIIIAELGEKSFGRIIKILCDLYKDEGYFKGWQEEDELLFSGKYNIPKDELNALVNTCVKRKFFDQALFIRYSILTSKDIQLNYLKAAETKSKIIIDRRYCLFDKAEVLSEKIRGRIQYINADFCDEEGESESRKTDISTLKGQKEGQIQVSEGHNIDISDLKTDDEKDDNASEGRKTDISTLKGQKKGQISSSEGRNIDISTLKSSLYNKRHNHDIININSIRHNHKHDIASIKSICKSLGVNTTHEILNNIISSFETHDLSSDFIRFTHDRISGQKNIKKPNGLLVCIITNPEKYPDYLQGFREEIAASDNPDSNSGRSPPLCPVCGSRTVIVTQYTSACMKCKSDKGYEVLFEFDKDSGKWIRAG